MTKGEIRRAIKIHSKKMRRKEIMASTKVGDRVSDKTKGKHIHDIHDAEQL